MKLFFLAVFTSLETPHPPDHLFPPTHYNVLCHMLSRSHRSTCSSCITQWVTSLLRSPDTWYSCICVVFAFLIEDVSHGESDQKGKTGFFFRATPQQEECKSMKSGLLDVWTSNYYAAPVLSLRLQPPSSAPVFSLHPQPPSSATIFSPCI